MVDKLFVAEELTGAGWTEEVCPTCDGNKKILMDDNSTDSKIQAILRKLYEKSKTQSAPKIKDILQKQTQVAAPDDDESQLWNTTRNSENQSDENAPP